MIIIISTYICIKIHYVIHFLLLWIPPPPNVTPIKNNISLYLSLSSLNVGRGRELFNAHIHCKFRHTTTSSGIPPPVQAYHHQFRHTTTSLGIPPPVQAYHHQFRHTTTSLGIPPPVQAYHHQFRHTTTSSGIPRRDQHRLASPGSRGSPH